MRGDWRPFGFIVIDLRLRLAVSSNMVGEETGPTKVEAVTRPCRRGNNSAEFGYKRQSLLPLPNSQQTVPFFIPIAMQTTLSPNRNPTVRRKASSRRPRAGSHLPPNPQEAHDAALHAIRKLLKGRTSYDALPVSFRLIILDTKLNVKRALQCLIQNGLSDLSASLSIF